MKYVPRSFVEILAGANAQLDEEISRTDEPEERDGRVDHFGALVHQFVFVLAATLGFSPEKTMKEK